MSDELTISEVAARTGIHPYTLRYYERIGLLAPIGRTSGGRRVFIESDLEWIEILKALRGTGMSIRKIRELMRLARGRRSDATEENRLLPRVSGRASIADRREDQGHRNDREEDQKASGGYRLSSQIDRFDSRDVVIVGGSSGMGLAAAKALHEEGARVTVVGRSIERLSAALTSLGNGKRVRAIQADMTIPNDREKIFAQCSHATDLVITAADLMYAPMRDFTASMVEKVLNSKVTAPFFMAQQFSRILPDDGSMTFVSGIAAERPIEGGAWTGIVNAALNAMVRGMALEFAPIRVNTVSPGWVATPLWDSIRPDPAERDQMFSAMAERIPARRIGAPEDIGKAIAAVIENGFMSGSTLYVDGGQRLV